MRRRNHLKISVLALLGIQLLSCAGPSVRSRAPASAKESENEVVFQMMLAKDDLNSFVQLKIDQLEEIYYRARGLTELYDHALEEERARGHSFADFQRRVISTGIYPKLMAYQMLDQDLRGRLVYVLRKMDQMASDPRVLKTWKFVDRYFAEVPWSTRLALNPLAEQLASVLPKNQYLQRGYKHLFVGAPEELLALPKDPNVSKHMDYLIRHALRVQTPIEERARGLAESIKPNLEANAGLGRKPQADSTDVHVVGRHLPKGQFSLAFDGSTESSASAVLAALQEKNVKANFFIGNSTLGVSAAIKNAGMTVGNGTATHDDLTKLFDDEINEEVVASNDDIFAISGIAPKLIKPPYTAGFSSSRVRKEIGSKGLAMVASKIDALAWSDDRPDKVAERIMKQMKMAGSGTISVSNYRSTTAQAIRAVLKSAGSDTQFVSLDEVASHANQ